MTNRKATYTKPMAKFGTRHHKHERACKVMPVPFELQTVHIRKMIRAMHMIDGLKQVFDETQTERADQLHALHSMQIMLLDYFRWVLKPIMPVWQLYQILQFLQTELFMPDGRTKHQPWNEINWFPFVDGMVTTNSATVVPGSTDTTRTQTMASSRRGHVPGTHNQRRILASNHIHTGDSPESSSSTHASTSASMVP